MGADFFTLLACSNDLQTNTEKKDPNNEEEGSSNDDMKKKQSRKTSGAKKTVLKQEQEEEEDHGEIPLKLVCLLCQEHLPSFLSTLCITCIAGSGF